MARTNGKSEIDPQGLDVQHELPPSDEAGEEKASSTGAEAEPLQAPSSNPGEFRSGVELIYKQLQDALAKLGLRPIPAKGEPFDPHLHQAVEMVETTEAEDHQVLEELQRGYKFKDRLLRPAMVRVAKNS